MWTVSCTSSTCRPVGSTAQVQANCDGGWRNVIDGRLWAVSGGDSPDLRVIERPHRHFDDDQRRWTSTAGPPVAAGGRVLVGSGKSGITYAFTPGAPRRRRSRSRPPWLWSAGGRL
jgi:hypothetical protein